MNLDCPLDWTISGVQRSSATKLEVKTNGRQTFVATNTGVGVKNLLTRSSARFDLIVVDLAPPPSSNSPLADWRNWIHSTKQQLSLSEELLSPHGIVLAELSDNALILTQLLTQLRVTNVVAWKKKYGPQNDSNRLVEPMHDFVLVLSSNAQTDSLQSHYVPWQVAGKSEDGTREFQDLAERYDVVGRAPLAIKPKKFWEWCAQNLVEQPRSLLDLNYTGVGLGEQVLGEIEATHIVWLGQEDTSTILDLVNRRSEVLFDMSPDEIFNEATVSGSCACISGLGSERKSAIHEAGRSAAYFDGKVDDSLSVSCSIDETFEEIANRYLRSLAGAVHFDVAPDVNMLAAATLALKSDGVMTLPILDCLARKDVLVEIARTFDYLGSLVLVPDQQSDGKCDIRAVLCKKSADQANVNLLRPLSESDYLSTDGDPRGPWRDPGHKGARSGSAATSFELYLPPYNWILKSGQLPPGMWRLNPDTGIVWGHPTEAGQWICEVEVSDGNNSVVTAVTFEVRADVQADSDDEAKSVSKWLRGSLHNEDDLVSPDQVHRLQLDKSQFVQLRASGGSPQRGLVGPPGNKVGHARTRYWEFSFGTFLQAVCEDRVVWARNKNGQLTTSRPRLKKFQRDEMVRNSAVRSVTEVEKFESSAIREFLVELFPTPLKIEISHDHLRTIRGSESSTSVKLKQKKCIECESDPLRIACSLGHVLQRFGVFLGEDPHEIKVFDWNVEFRWLFNIAGEKVALFVDNVILTDALASELNAALGADIEQFFACRVLMNGDSNFVLVKVDHR